MKTELETIQRQLAARTAQANIDICIHRDIHGNCYTKAAALALASALDFDRQHLDSHAGVRWVKGFIGDDVEFFIFYKEI